MFFHVDMPQVRRLISGFSCFLLLIVVSAQETLPTTIDVNAVSAATRSTWCLGQLKTCNILCNGGIKDNDCNKDTLDFTCTCASNSSSPGLQYYQNSIPTFICEFTFQTCISASAGDASAQAACAADEKANCGHNDPSLFVAPVPEQISSTGGSSGTISVGSPPVTTLTTVSNGVTRTVTLFSTPSPARTPTTSSNLSSSSKPVSSTSPSQTPVLSDSSSRGPQSSTSSTAAGRSDSASVPSPSSAPGPTDKGSGGLSTGAKAGIGIGVVLGIILLVLAGWGLVVYGRRSAIKKNADGGLADRVGGKSELSAGPEVVRAELPDTPLSEEEKRELERRRRAAELAGDPGLPRVEIADGTPAGERRELEARRAAIRYEMG
ncbi:hypothetical protein VTL71DRAFT_1304 [Oculimacula yallundae]|uniref:DUF7707 domain-containing protein n=1 Tax=Oculimacula yallundae TaxID=86028 RepID=A0ABR4CAR7_9HELO